MGTDMQVSDAADKIIMKTYKPQMQLMNRLAGQIPNLISLELLLKISRDDTFAGIPTTFLTSYLYTYNLDNM
eukprot:1393537-Amorphochlora_amoeboformis.AAC.1